MHCSFGPYQITSSISQLTDTTFIDMSKSYRVVLFSDCSSPISAPCQDSLLVHNEDNCPLNANILWYECPSRLGRIYTLQINPCYVIVSSFENGLISMDSGDATVFGTEKFCFGKIYSKAGEFVSENKSLVSFEFEGNTFSITGNSGTCPEDLIDCSYCASSQPDFTSQATMPSPPDDPVSVPVQTEDGAEIPPIVPIPPETRSFLRLTSVQGQPESWSWAGANPAGQDVLCETERVVSTLPPVFSHDDASVASLPSGHTIVAYESRREDGLTKISLAIISSSVKINIRYYRKLSRGTLLNNLVESRGVGSFEVFDDIVIPVDVNGKPGSGEELGFLSGPLAGYVFPVTKVTRETTDNRVKITFNFTVSQNNVFDGKNHDYDIKWFLTNNQDSSELPGNSNTITILDLPYHTDSAGVEVPVANPSVAVASNNIMTMPEQNIYVAYQAFENNQWRVYLREVLLGSSDSIAPTYSFPYIFDDTQQQVELMSATTTATAIATIDEDFIPLIFNNIGLPLELTARWIHDKNWSSSPFWVFRNQLDNISPQINADLMTCLTSGSPICMYAGREFRPDRLEGGIIPDNNFFCNPEGTYAGRPSLNPANLYQEVGSNARTFARSTTPIINSATGEGYLSVEVGALFDITIFSAPAPNNQSIFPEIWFILGHNDAVTSSFGERWKIQIARGNGVPGPFTLSSGNINISPQINFNGFVIRLYDGLARSSSPSFDQTQSSGEQTDLPVREIYFDPAIHDFVYDGSINALRPLDYFLHSTETTFPKTYDRNRFTIKTYPRGQKRVFEVYLSHEANVAFTPALMATFIEDDPSLTWDGVSTEHLSMGPVYGFGFASTFVRANVALDHYYVSPIPDPSILIFYDDDMSRIGVQNPNYTNTETTTGYLTSSYGEPQASKYLYNTRNAPSSQAPWSYARLGICNDLPAIHFTQNFSDVPINIFPKVLGSALGFPKSSFTLDCWDDISETDRWSYFSIRVPTSDKRSNPPIDMYNVSMIVAAARNFDAKAHDGAYPHLTFVMRLNTFDEDWWKGYRIRISRFDAISNYASGTQSNGSVRPTITAGDKYWRIQYFDGGELQTGEITDPVTEEVWLKIGTDTNIDWTDPEWDISSGNLVNSVYPYFKVNVFEVAGNETKFEVYFGTTNNINAVDDISFELLHVFQVPSSRSSGTYYGFAIHDGSAFEFELDNEDYRSLGIVNYVRLSAISGLEESTGACCRSIGRCDAGVVSSDCQSPDVFFVNSTCSNADCTSSFPTGAACNELGFCFGNITEDYSILQGYGQCEGCSWTEGVSCADRGCSPVIDVLGSCCRPEGSCVDEITYQDCQLYFGNTEPFANWRQNLTCSSPCSPVNSGACCSPTGCSITNSLEACEAIGGTFQGLGTDCVSNDCVGACCNGVTCSQQNQSDCENSGYTFLGYGVDCAPDPCTVPDPVGACCQDDGSCIDGVVQSSCTVGYWTEGTDCSTCPSSVVTGACCDPMTGLCENNVTENTCSESGRYYKGNFTDCTNIDCTKPVGACCTHVNTVCTESMTAEDCNAIGGRYLGNFTRCISNVCLETSGIDVDDSDPYVAGDIQYKPEDLWKIQVGDNEYITRVLYHMQKVIEDGVVTPGTEEIAPNNAVDFMFMIDHSGSMAEEIEKVRQAVPDLARELVNKGFDVRFGFVIFGRGRSQYEGRIPSPLPLDYTACDESATFKVDIFNGLQVSLACSTPGSLEGSAEQGFTRSADYLQKALGCWGVFSGRIAPWAAINYAINDSDFSWRDNASRFIFFVSDTFDENANNNCGGYLNDKQLAKASLINNNIAFIPAINPRYIDVYRDVATDSGWTNQIFDVSSEDYGDIFTVVTEEIDTKATRKNATIIERSSSGTEASFLKKAEIIVSYDGDLTDLWTFSKADLEFRDDHVPFPGTPTKGLTNFPFPLATTKVYGIDNVHIQGIAENWVTFSDEGPVSHEYPAVGSRESSSNSPILISSNSTRPKVFVNNRNQVIVAYENYDSGIAQIEIKGTGDFHQDSIVGAKGSRIQRFLVPQEFSYRHSITLPSIIRVSTDIDEYGADVTETPSDRVAIPGGLNQICDFVIDNSDVTHIVWQSNASGYWEIYYANSSNMFEPVRLTKMESRSSSPSISINEDGYIFVVYHDDRFGPFEIMMASKQEDRVIPLLEQDAYLASMNNSYTHYTNVIPLFVDNPSGEELQLGQFWATKLSGGEGNDSENMLFKINEDSGAPTGGINTGSFEYESIAFTSTGLYAINSLGTMFHVGNVQDDQVNVFTSPVVLGTINLNIDGFENHRILDMTSDRFDRVWVLIYERETSGGGNIGFGTMSVEDRLRIEQVSTSDATTLASGIFDNNESIAANTEGSITVTSDNKFYITFRAASGNLSTDSSLAVSDYPIISDQVATFNFSVFSTILEDAVFVAMAADAIDNLFAITNENDLYVINRTDATKTFRASLTTDSSGEPSTPIGETSGLAYHLIRTPQEAAGGEFFHILVEFYDNIALDGQPYLSIDSRENLEAFINDLQDPYFKDAGGVFLEYDQIGIVFFDASLFVPGNSRSAYPYNFESNQTYFPKVFAIDSNGNPRLSGVPQQNSLSCSKCNRFSNNNFNSNSCSYSFVIQNTDIVDKYYNFQIDFYADTDKQFIVRRFEAIYGDNDLQYVEVNNNPATEIWTSEGLLIPAGKSFLIQVYPGLDPQAGFLCGVNYTAQINMCFDQNNSCSDFTMVTATNPSATISSFIFNCECSSNIFTNRLIHLDSVSRWNSSAFGHSDTRVTNSPRDSILPVIHTRGSGTAIILWQDYNTTNNCTNPPCIRSATFRDTTQDQLRSSGTESWFDYDFGISGHDPAMTIDLYDRVNTIYEKQQQSTGETVRDLPRNALYGKICDFVPEQTSSVPTENVQDCDISSLESNIISLDAFISSKIVKKIKIKDNYVNYYTYNASGILTPIVSDCNVIIEIHGTPEIIAIRTKNEDNPTFGPWCPWSPQISDFVMEKQHRISGGAGIKEICVQLMTYAGITTRFCLPVIADFQPVVFETKFYKDIDINGDYIADFTSFPADKDANLIELPMVDGVSIASLVYRAGRCNQSQTPCSRSSECSPGDVCQSTVLVEIIPDRTFQEATITFDVIQQGINDIFGLIAHKGRNNKGRVAYRGEFPIEREDNIFNIDGLARISPLFPDSCKQSVSTSSVFEPYSKDKFNVMSRMQEVTERDTTDHLANFRQEISGRIGVTLDIRANEDPYFVFGDPNYSIKMSDGSRIGVPFINIAKEILIGQSPDQSGDIICEPQECSGNYVFNPETCKCEPPQG